MYIINNLNWEVNVKLCKEAIKKYKERWARKENVDKRVLTDWEHMVNSLIDKRVARHPKQVLRNKECSNFLKDFHRRFVLVPADKAANNIIVVCKRFYLDVVCKELYCLDSSSPHTYIECTSDSGCIVEDHLNYMKKGRIDVPLEMHELPRFYWLPKVYVAIWL